MSPIPSIGPYTSASASLAPEFGQPVTCSSLHLQKHNICNDTPALTEICSYTKILEVNLFAFAYRLFRRDMFLYQK